MSNPTISVVIPAYNEAATLRETLTSLKNQTYQPLEIIVSDNNSTDQTAAIAKELGAKVWPVTTQGYVYALNGGMMQAQGQVIAVTDADTRVLPEWLEQVAKSFSDPKVVGLTGGIVIDDPSALSRIWDGLYGLFLRVNFLISKPHLVGFNFAVRKDAFVAINGLDAKFTMSPDVDLGLRLKKQGRVVYNRDMQVHPSTRRWDSGLWKTFVEYSTGYFYSAWFRTPPPVKQSVIRTA